MSINKLNLNNKDKYIEQAFEILNFFKSIIIEVHHIGSSRLENFPYHCDMDILFIVKSYDDVRNLADILIAEGYAHVSNFSDYFRDDMVMRKVVDGQIVNMIFMSSTSWKKEDILNCTENLLFNEEFSGNFKNLKKAFFKNEMTEAEYDERKYRLFQMIKGEGDHLTSV
ncbi:MAG TPA: GrpB family protein [Jeotgalicoccus aerolatus]|nr:GrpB family protein [Jeotgalicoccus aerolatus]